jgi:hypothetical protein
MGRSPTFITLYPNIQWGRGRKERAGEEALRVNLDPIRTNDTPLEPGCKGEIEKWKREEEISRMNLSTMVESCT